VKDDEDLRRAVALLVWAGFVVVGLVVLSR